MALAAWVPYPESVRVVVVAVVGALCGVRVAGAQDDDRAQYPAFLRNSYFAINLGYVDYAFSDRQLEPGFQALGIAVPHVAARVAVLGHEFNRYFSLQATYMRPVRFVTYTDINSDRSAHHVWTHFGGVTLKALLPVTTRTSIYGEGGLGITSRHGFGTSAVPIVRNAHYASALLGAGGEYRLTPAWDLTAGATYSPSSARGNEPGALLLSAGFRYTMRPLTPDEVRANLQPGVIFPKRALQLEYSTGYGYGVNTFVSKTLPVFWGGNVKVDRGLALHYERNVFHTARIFALDFGTSASTWRSRENHDRFFTLSIYPLFRFTGGVLARRTDVYLQDDHRRPEYGEPLHLPGFHRGGRIRRASPSRDRQRQDQSLFKWKPADTECRTEDSAHLRRRIHVLKRSAI